MSLVEKRNLPGFLPYFLTTLIYVMPTLLIILDTALLQSLNEEFVIAKKIKIKIKDFVTLFFANIANNIFDVRLIPLDHVIHV